MSTPVARAKLLRLSSEDKQGGESNASFSVILNNASFVQNVHGVIPKSVTFKHTFPNLFDGNNTIVYTYDGTQSSFTITSAWYDVSELITALNAGFAADVVVTGSVVVSLDSVTSSTEYLKFTPDLALTVHGKDINPMADVLGADGSAALTMVYPPDLGGLSTVYLCSGELAGANCSASSNNGEQVPVVVSIPIKVPYGGQVEFRSFDDDIDAVIYPNKKSFTKVGLSLCTRSGAQLDLGQHNLTAMFKIIGSEYFPAY